ncbi:ASCH/PUA domain-containing protein [Alicyclobacillus macrosporangiidus]|uniref:ASCH/PUA domain-containing protein n=1 Tax=Alicyclobacillus macrosporangiidus TaxID=392015 RepID=UPI00068AD1DE|nr:ASCH/PUA domain-containing protein [Alicyclobacillus macrosporangiidus]
MATHELKTWPEYFEPLLHGEKTVELRKDDRGYAVGDTLILREYDPDTRQYTGRICTRTVTHILRGGPWLQDGYVALSVVDKEKEEALERVANAAKVWRNCSIDRLGFATSPEEAKAHHVMIHNATVALTRAVDALEDLEVTYDARNPEGNSSL